MSDLKPLIDSAAFWISTDAALRIFWSAFGAIAIIAAVSFGLALAYYAGRSEPRDRTKKSPDRKDSK